MKTKTFNYGGFDLRMAELDGDRWFAVPDICRILGRARNASRIARTWLRKGKSRMLLLSHTRGSEQNTTVVNEVGFFEVVQRTKTPQAAAVMAWMVGELMPSLRPLKPKAPEPKATPPERSDKPAVYNFHDQPVRVLDREGETWWVVKDICDVLGLTDPYRAVERLDGDEKGTNTIHTPGGEQEMICINESGLYNLLLTSRKPEAKMFRRWITHEVVPTIRRTGRYEIQTRQQDDVEEAVQKVEVLLPHLLVLKKAENLLNRLRKALG